MKRIIFNIISILLLVFIISSCDQDSSKDNTKDSTEDYGEMVEFKNEDYGVSIEYPDSWEKLYDQKALDKSSEQTPTQTFILSVSKDDSDITNITILVEDPEGVITLDNYIETYNSFYKEVTGKDIEKIDINGTEFAFLSKSIPDKVEDTILYEDEKYITMIDGQLLITQIRYQEGEEEEATKIIESLTVN